MSGFAVCDGCGKGPRLLCSRCWKCKAECCECFVKKQQVAHCCNAECQWAGAVSDCLTPKHEPRELLCPVCNEVVEIDS